MTTSTVGAITAVFTAIAQWIVSCLNDMTALFYNADTSTLTFLGILAVCGLAFSVVFLIMGIIQRFLHFRG